MLLLLTNKLGGISQMLKIEFFHDVICSFCFPMSARMRRLAEKYNNIEISHRSFALGWSGEDFVRSFGSREAVKPEVLNHWAHANENDDEHRFNIEGMRGADFNFPISRPGLVAAKAAAIVGGDAAYWDLFDRIQEKLFVQSRNIEDISVLEEAVKETAIDFDAWKAAFEDPATEQAVLADLQLARAYGVNSAPTLVINQKYALPGAIPQEQLEQIFQQVAEQEGVPLNKMQLIDLGNSGGACSLVDGEWVCD